MKVQEKILAELVFLRAEKLGWVEQRKGLEGQLQIKDREIVVERERGDWFKKAAETAQSMDKNAVKMDTNAVAIQTGLEGRIADKNEKIADLTDSLRRCQTNQKWIAGVSAVVGGVGGFLLKGQSDRFLGTGVSPSFQLQPLSQPRPQFRLYK